MLSAVAAGARIIGLAAVGAAGILVAGAASQAQPSGSALPGGASSIQETYQDWRVACVQQGPVKRCVLSQQQARQDGQRVLAVELAADAAGKTVTGALVLPFGLALDAGVTLQIDDGAVGAPWRFSTCLPAGCIVPLAFDAATLTALRKAGALKIKAKASDNNQPVDLTISLKGISAALDRTIALAN